MSFSKTDGASAGSSAFKIRSFYGKIISPTTMAGEMSFTFSALKTPQHILQGGMWEVAEKPAWVKPFFDFPLK